VTPIIANEIIINNGDGDMAMAMMMLMMLMMGYDSSPP
jgi:hypothetical protein